MHDWSSLSHVRWDCKYHVVIIPKYRRKMFRDPRTRRAVGAVLRRMCEQRGVELLEGNASVDHIHMCLKIPPKFSVANTMGFLKGKSAVRVYRDVKYSRIRVCTVGPFGHRGTA